MDSKGSWCYIILDSADEKPDDYDDDSVVPVYHYDVYDGNDLIPVESFESRNMNTIIREVFAQSSLDAMQADSIGIGFKSRMIGFEHDKWNVIDSMLES